MNKSSISKYITNGNVQPNTSPNSGQALVVLLFFAIMGITIITAAAIMLYTNTSSLVSGQEGTFAYYVAQSGIQEGLIRLVRDSSYTGGTLTVGSGTATIQVSNGVITSTGFNNGLVRKIQAQTITDQTGIKISSWKEIN